MLLGCIVALSNDELSSSLCPPPLLNISLAAGSMAVYYNGIYDRTDPSFEEVDNFLKPTEDLTMRCYVGCPAPANPGDCFTGNLQALWISSKPMQDPEFLNLFRFLYEASVSGWGAREAWVVVVDCECLSPATTWLDQ